MVASVKQPRQFAEVAVLLQVPGAVLLAGGAPSAVASNMRRSSPAAGPSWYCGASAKQSKRGSSVSSASGRRMRSSQEESR